MLNGNGLAGAVTQGAKRLMDRCCWADTQAEGDNDQGLVVAVWLGKGKGELGGKAKETGSKLRLTYTVPNSDEIGHIDHRNGVGLGRSGHVDGRRTVEDLLRLKVLDLLQRQLLLLLLLLVLLLLLLRGRDGRDGFVIVLLGAGHGCWVLSWRSANLVQ